MNTELIQLKGVTKKFKKNVVLEDVDLDIPEKQITGIIGASGMGKTTILKMIIGFYKPDSGRITYLKRDVLKDLRNIRQIFGFSTEDGSFYQDLTVKENLYHFGSLYGMKMEEIKKRTKEILDFVGLSKAVNTKARDISVGMKKRLDFACSLVHDPEVLILDEPTADLDPLLREQILSLIQKIKKTGTTVVLTTQLLEEMDKIADYIAVLHKKKIIEKDSPKNIRKKYSCDNLNDVFGKIFSRDDIKDTGEDIEKNIKEKPKNEESSEEGEKEPEKKKSWISSLKKEKKDSEREKDLEKNKEKDSEKKKDKSKENDLDSIFEKSAANKKNKTDLLKKENTNKKINTEEKSKNSEKKKEESEDLVGKFLLKNKKNSGNNSKLNKKPKDKERFK